MTCCVDYTIYCIYGCQHDVVTGAVPERNLNVLAEQFRVLWNKKKTKKKKSPWNEEGRERESPMSVDNQMVTLNRRRLRRLC